MNHTEQLYRDTEPTMEKNKGAVHNGFPDSSSLPVPNYYLDIYC